MVLCGTLWYFLILFGTFWYCNCIVTRGGLYDEILPEPKGNPEGGAQGISRGLRHYFIVYPYSSHNKSHSQLPLLANIFSYGLCELAIFFRIG